MKKLLSLALACTLTLGLASCGGTGTSTSSNAPASSSAVESPAAQFDAASYLSGDYPKLPEDGPAYSLSIGHAMQESTESHKMLLYGDNVFEKDGIRRDRTGDGEKTRCLCGKRGIFNRDGPAMGPQIIRQLE